MEPISREQILINKVSELALIRVDLEMALQSLQHENAQLKQQLTEKTPKDEE